MNRNPRASDPVGIGAGIFFVVSALWWILGQNAFLSRVGLVLVLLAASVDLLTFVFLRYCDRVVRLDFPAGESLAARQARLERSLRLVRLLTRCLITLVMSGLVFWMVSKRAPQPEFISFCAAIVALTEFLDWRNSRRMENTLRPMLEESNGGSGAESA